MKVKAPRDSRGIRYGGPPAAIKKLQNGLLIGTPFVGSIFTVVYLTSHPVSNIAIVQFAFWYLITGVGIGVGFHRYFTHRSFKTYGVLRLLLGIAGSLAFQGSVTRWIADHRRHHKYSDREHDTHTPHKYSEDGRTSSLVKNMWYAHVGWMFDETTTDASVYAPDLLRDPIAVWLTRWYVSLTVASLALPYCIGYLFGGAEAAFQSLLLGGFLRITLLHNVIWAVNSVGHQWGSQPAGSHDHSRNNWIVAALTFGEGWHNNHHSSPRCAFNNWRGYEIDINGAIILLLKRLGIVWDVHETRRKSVSNASNE